MLGLLVLAGICLVAGVESTHLGGLGLALLSALLAAVSMVLNRKLVVGGVEPMTMVGWEMTSSAVICFLALVCTVFAQALTNHLLRRISAYKFNLVANFEPVYGMLAAAFLFGEHEELQITFHLGALCIVLANFLHPWLKKRFSRQLE